MEILSQMSHQKMTLLPDSDRISRLLKMYGVAPFGSAISLCKCAYRSNLDHDTGVMGGLSEHMPCRRGERRKGAAGLGIPSVRCQGGGTVTARRMRARPPLVIWPEPLTMAALVASPSRPLPGCRSQTAGVLASRQPLQMAGLGLLCRA